MNHLELTEENSSLKQRITQLETQNRALTLSNESLEQSIKLLRQEIADNPAIVPSGVKVTISSDSGTQDLTAFESSVFNPLRNT